MKPSAMTRSETHRNIWMSIQMRNLGQHSRSGIKSKWSGWSLRTTVRVETYLAFVHQISFPLNFDNTVGWFDKEWMRQVDSIITQLTSPKFTTMGKSTRYLPTRAYPFCTICSMSNMLINNRLGPDDPALVRRYGGSSPQDTRRPSGSRPRRSAATRG